MCVRSVCLGSLRNYIGMGVRSVCLGPLGNYIGICVRSCLLRSLKELHRNVCSFCGRRGPRLLYSSVFVSVWFLGRLSNVLAWMLE